MVEAGIHKEIQLDFVQRKPGSNEADVKAGGAGAADEIDDVGARERLTAREVGLQNAGSSGFLENAGPDVGREFVRTRLQFNRIRAVDTVERATMRELGDER
jgi:hypothetical protein